MLPLPSYIARRVFQIPSVTTVYNIKKAQIRASFVSLIVFVRHRFNRPHPVKPPWLKGGGVSVPEGVSGSEGI